MYCFVNIFLLLFSAIHTFYTEYLSVFNMDKLSVDDLTAMEDQLRQGMEEDRKYWRVNDVKCDAIHTAKTYEEFADRVAAAHLRPLEKKDYKNKQNKSWNPCASKESKDLNE